MRLTKPPLDNPHAVFKYGVECGIEQERERIIALLEARSSEFAESHDWADVELITYLVALIKGESNA